MKKNLVFLALASIGLASCNGGFKQEDGGLLYEIHQDKGGPAIQVGDWISVNVIAKTDGDSVLFNTYEANHPIQMVIPKSQYKGDIFNGLEKLAEGDSATIKINADSLFKHGQPKPPGFKGKYFVYDIKVNKVIAKGTLSEQVFEGRVTDYVKIQNAALKKLEPAKIQTYITNNKLKVTETKDSLYYVITAPGSGPNVAPGDTAVVNYTGRTLNGKVFDTSVKDEAVKAKLNVDPYSQNKYKPIHIPVGVKRVIPGWDEGLQLLNKGSKAIFIIPSSLAYGDMGVPSIGLGPYTPITFELEVLDIIHPNPNAPKPTVMLPPVQQAPVKR